MKKILCLLTLSAGLLASCSAPPEKTDDHQVVLKSDGTWALQNGEAPAAPEFKKSIRYTDYKGALVKYIGIYNDSIATVTFVQGDSVKTEYWGRGLVENLGPGDNLGDPQTAVRRASKYNLAAQMEQYDKDFEADMKALAEEHKK
jgi:hypothetical protein